MTRTSSPRGGPARPASRRTAGSPDAAASGAGRVQGGGDPGAPGGRAAEPAPARTAQRAAQRPVGRAVTEELPVVPAEQPYLDRGRARQRRRSAPYALRLVVWLLVLLLVLLLLGVLVEREHPSWLDFLRRTPSAARSSPGARPVTSARGSGHPTSSTTPSGFHVVSESANGATYDVGAASYALLVATLPNHPCWTMVEEPAGSGRLYAAETLQPSSRPASFPVSGSATLTVAAAVRSIGVEVGGHVVGTISSPKLGYRYTFEAGSP